MLTRRTNQIANIRMLEKGLPEWERQDYLAMDREEREMYLNYLRAIPKGKRVTT